MGIFFKIKLKYVGAGSDVVSKCEDIAVKSPQSCLGKKKAGRVRQPTILWAKLVNNENSSWRKLNDKTSCVDPPCRLTGI